MNRLVRALVVALLLASPAWAAKGKGKKGKGNDGPVHAWRKFDVVARGRLVGSGNFWREGELAEVAPKPTLFGDDADRTGDEDDESPHAAGWGLGGSFGAYLAKPFGRKVPVSPGIQYHRDTQWHRGVKRLVPGEPEGSGLVEETELVEDRARYTLKLQSVALSTQFPLSMGRTLVMFGVDIGYVWGPVRTTHELASVATVDTTARGGLFAVTWAIGGRIGKRTHVTVDLPLLQMWSVGVADDAAVPFRSDSGISALKVPLALGVSVGI